MIEGVATVERNRRGMALPTLVVIEAVLALGLVVWVVSGSVWGATALGVAAVVSAGLVRVGGRPSVFGRIVANLSFSWSRMRRDHADLAPAPFDIP
ncbi:type VII secretion protein EccE, partial [Gordonia sp. BP-94]|nr:type VII secretion protein EccE [Gordonia sp. BP-94]